MIQNETGYEINQRFNSIVSWLHSYRYKNIQQVIEEFSSSNNTDGFYPDFTDTSKKADNGRGGVSCRNEENTQ
ncbi:MAG: hypothetical protein ABW096_19290, partial [Candidatus Thiodiazotropha sp.]